jgi:hypothetical protein
MARESKNREGKSGSPLTERTTGQKVRNKVQRTREGAVAETSRQAAEEAAQHDEVQTYHAAFRHHARNIEHPKLNDLECCKATGMQGPPCIEISGPPPDKSPKPKSRSRTQGTSSRSADAQETRDILSKHPERQRGAAKRLVMTLTRGLATTLGALSRARRTLTLIVYPQTQASHLHHLGSRV